MKKVILSMLSLATLFVTSCTSDDAESANVPGNETIISEGSIDHTTGTLVSKPTWQNVDLSDDVATATLSTESLTTNKTISGTVALTGAYAVKSGATLTIEAGTEIIASKGDGVYILIEKGAKIDIQGTSSNPVLMSSVDAKSADWGGIVICGDATTTAGVDALAEVGDNLVYGGSDDADDSGSINYLVLKGTGSSINPDAQYNGISFYAVGSGTTIENIAVIDGADDGVEFFGGTVNVTNIYLQDILDDSIDWTEGYSGTVTNIYISQDANGFSTAFEGDGTNKNPKFTNVTAVSSVDGIAFQFKKTSGATVTNLNLSGFATEIQFRDEDQFDESTVIIDGEEVVIL